MSAASFLVIGEAIVDVFHRGAAVVRHPGGSPTNVAVGLSRLGHPVAELSYLGQDDDGTLLRDHLRAAGVREQPGALVAPASSVAEVTVDAAGDASYAFSVTWDAPTTIDWTGIDVVHAGSIALALEPGAGHVLALLRSRPASVLATIDPNVRPAFLPTEDALARLTPFFELADLVKLSDEDAAVLYPGLAPDAVLDRLLDGGAGIAAITLGARGAILASAAGRVGVPADAPVVVDTVGAGDSFMAALISAVATAGAWEPDAAELLRFGRYAARAAAITVSRTGADLPTAAELGVPV